MDPSNQLTSVLVSEPANLLALANAQSIDERAAIYARAVISFNQQWNAAGTFDMPRPGKRLVESVKLLEQ
jgi:hypothetical protein